MLEALKSSRFLFIFPDKNQSTSLKSYQDLASFATMFPIEVYLVDIKWKKHKSMLECMLEATQKVQDLVDELKPTETYFFGYGIGAMVAAEMGYIYRANGILLCSMPPFFEEELSNLSWFQRYKGIRRIYGAKDHTAYPNPIINSRTVFLQVERERKLLSKVSDIRKKTFSNSLEVFIPKIRKGLNRKKYMVAVKEELKKIIY
jgi:hypothetical protein